MERHSRHLRPAQDVYSRAAGSSAHFRDVQRFHQFASVLAAHLCLLELFSRLQATARAPLGSMQDVGAQIAARALPNTGVSASTSCCGCEPCQLEQGPSTPRLNTTLSLAFLIDAVFRCLLCIFSCQISDDICRWRSRIFPSCSAPLS